MPNYGQSPQSGKLLGQLRPKSLRSAFTVPVVRLFCVSQIYDKAVSSASHYHSYYPNCLRGDKWGDLGDNC